ncbi:MAG: SDR family oxidoreductase [Betaproteobacteria bacterium]|nr:SDR family oxidoreductase [Betaproteobacteria bacterium]
MKLGLAGKFAIVGGSSEGIGYAIARLLAEEGAGVAMVARGGEALAASAKRIADETGARTLAIPADIRRAEDCARIVATAAAEFGRLDILVNNDGAPPLGALLEFDDAAWDKAVQQNLMSVVRLCRDAVPHMRAAGGGRIVNITALSVLQPIPKFGLSVATWAAVIGYAKTLSLEVASDAITVNTICPGRIETTRLAKVYTSDSLQQLAKEVPLGRLGQPAEIASLVALLVSERGAYITGSTFHVDGGRRANLL